MSHLAGFFVAGLMATHLLCAAPPRLEGGAPRAEETPMAARAPREPTATEYWVPDVMNARMQPIPIIFPWKEADIDPPFAWCAPGEGAGVLRLELDTSTNQGDLFDWPEASEAIPDIRFADRKFELVLRNEAFPFEGHVYAYTGMYDGYAILERITPLLPQSVRPVTSARQLCLREKPSWLFWDPVSRRAGRVQVLEIARDKQQRSVARVHVEPPPFARPGERGAFSLPSYEVSVRMDDVFSCAHQGYRVLNIVEPQDVELEDGRTVHLIGWIELDPEPLPPPDEPADAPEAE